MGKRSSNKFMILFVSFILLFAFIPELQSFPNLRTLLFKFVPCPSSAWGLTFIVPSYEQMSYPEIDGHIPQCPLFVSLPGRASKESDVLPNFARMASVEGNGGSKVGIVSDVRWSSFSGIGWPRPSTTSSFLGSWKVLCHGHLLLVPLGSISHAPAWKPALPITWESHFNSVFL